MAGSTVAPIQAVAASARVLRATAGAQLPAVAPAGGGAASVLGAAVVAALAAVLQAIGVAAVAAVLQAVGGAALAAQEPSPVPGEGPVCEAGLISRMDVVANRIFDTEASEEAGALKVYYGLMNALHVTTRESYIRQEAFFREGDCYDPFLLTETERVLRALDFLATAAVTSEQQSDGTRHVTIETRDAVSIKLSLGVTFDDGFTFENVGLTEINLLGRAITLGVFRREQRELLERGVELGSPRILGAPLDLRLSGGATRDGSFGRQSVFLPFMNERARWAFRQSLDWTLQPFAYAVSPNPELTHALLPVQSFKAELTGARRWGDETGAWWVGGGISWEAVTFPGYPEDVQIVRDKDFKRPEPAPDTVATILAPQTVEQGATRLHFMFARRDLAFQRRTRLDGVDAVEDIRSGTEVVLTLAPSIPFLETSAPRSDDIYARLEVYQGGTFDRFVYGALFSVEALRFYKPDTTTTNRWRDRLVELEAALYWQPQYRLNDPGRHTLYLSTSAATGHSTTRPFQLTLGGRDGVRGYSRDAFPGGGRFLATLEERVFLGWPRTQLFDVGAAAFIDVGRTWAGDVPFGVDSGWKASVGIGIRLGSPSGSNNTTRIELTLPLESDPGPGATYFRFYADLGGVLRAFRTEQVQQSRFSGVSSDLVNRPRRSR